MITFEESRRNAYRLLGDAADEIRMGDWQPAPSPEQRTAVRETLRLIGEAKTRLDLATRGGDTGVGADADPATATTPWCNGTRIGTTARCGATNRHASHGEGETPRWFDHD